jgi:predicted dehydrogenase
MNIAILGCGYVAEFYGLTLENHSNLQLVGAFDRNPATLAEFQRRWPCKPYSSLAELASDPGVELVLNLTNPRSHFETTSELLLRGKHVYSEKPVAMNVVQALELRDLASARGLYLGAAPCSVLSDAAQTLWKALSNGVVGRVRLVYGNFDDGMIAPALSPWNWRNASGIPWPAKDEFEVGCTYEHAGYLLTWLAAFFGPALAVTSFASCQIPDKGIQVDRMAPDFTVGCIEYSKGVVARITCSLVAPKDRSLTIIGDQGILSVADVRDDLCPVYLQRTPPRGRTGGIERRVNRLRRALNLPGAERDWHLRSRVPAVKTPSKRFVSVSKRVDFCRGPAEMAAAIREDRPSRMSADLAVHITELVELLQDSPAEVGRRRLTSTFPVMQPPPWDGA